MIVVKGIEWVLEVLVLVMVFVRFAEMKRRVMIVDNGRKVNEK